MLSTHIQYNNDNNDSLDDIIETDESVLIDTITVYETEPQMGDNPKPSVWKRFKNLFS